MKSNRLTIDQRLELCRRLDDVVKVGHVTRYHCECNICKALDDYAEELGMRSNNDRRQEQSERTKAMHAKDAVKISGLVSKGFNKRETAKRIGRSATYVSQIMREYEVIGND